MEVKSASKVGILVIFVGILAISMYIYLSHISPNSYLVRVTFSDTRGLTNQAIVRMQGVPIGEVKSIKLNTRTQPFEPVVIVSVERKYHIPSNYVWVISSGLLINSAALTVSPPATGAPGPDLAQNNTAVVQGHVPTDLLASISPKLSGMVGNAGETLSDLRQRMNVLTSQLHILIKHTDTLVQHTDSTLNSAHNLISDPEMQHDLRGTISNFHTVSQQAVITSRSLSKQLTILLKNGNGQISRLTTATTHLVDNLGQTLDDARTVVQKLEQQVSNPRLQRSLQETLELASSTLASVRQITGDIHRVTGNPELAPDLQQTVENLKVTTAKTADVMQRVDVILQKFQHTVNNKGGIHAPKVTGTVDVSEQANPGRFRVDLNGSVPLNAKSNLILGLYDLGEDTRLNLQMGNHITPNLMLRYGLHAGTLGIGSDYALSPSVLLDADLFNTHQPRLDLRAYFRVNNNASIWLGGDSLTGHPVPLIGVQLKE